jgi:hypothetical protein
VKVLTEEEFVLMKDIGKDGATSVSDDAIAKKE